MFQLAEKLPTPKNIRLPFWHRRT